ncbi:MAG: hypothetical protein SOH81_11395 [Acetobacter sp.]|jgi:hypothetical protein
MSETLADVQYSDADFAHDHRAIDFYRDHGCATVMDAFQIANILHTDGMVREASNFYRIAFDLHSKEPHVFPNAHVLLNVSLLCLLKAGENPSEEDMQLLRGYSIPCYNYIRGVMISWREGDHLRALETMGNCYEEFHTGEECDRIYLSIACRLYEDKLAHSVLSPSQNMQFIPLKIYGYCENNSTTDIKDELAHGQLNASFDIKIFRPDDAAVWLYQNYGVEARRIFLMSHSSIEASNFLRLHVIYKLGGWWMEKKNQCLEQEYQIRVLSRRYSHIFFQNEDGEIQGDYFGAFPNSSVIGDALFSLYRNYYLHENLDVFRKSGSGILERSLNRAFHSYKDDDKLSMNIYKNIF